MPTQDNVPNFAFYTRSDGIPRVSILMTPTDALCKDDLKQLIEKLQEIHRDMESRS